MLDLIFCFLLSRFVPESVRWLLVSEKKEKARKILEEVARVNKKEMPEDELYIPVKSSNKGVFELFKTRRLAKLSLIQCYAW